jgi:outer membrane protein assembly factor BamB
LAVNASDPIYHKGRVFLSTTYSKTAAMFDIRGEQPKLIWKMRGAPFSSGFLRGEHLYCFTDGSFTCREFATGKELWSAPGIGNGSVLFTEDKILLLSEPGGLLIVKMSASEFSTIRHIPVLEGTNWTPPALCDGKLYVRNKDGDLVCLQIAASGSR